MIFWTWQIRHTHPRPGVSQVESLRFRFSTIRGSMEFSPKLLIMYTYQHLHQGRNDLLIIVERSYAALFLTCDDVDAESYK